VLEDLPASWAATAHPATQSFAGGGTCGLPLTRKKGSDAVAAAFSYGNGTAKLTEYVGAGTAVQRRWAQAVKQFKSCHDIKMAAGKHTLEVPVTALKFPTVGPKTHAYQLKLTQKSVTLAADIVEFQAGPYIVALTFSSVGTPPLTTVANLVRLAIQKILTPSYVPPTTTTTAPGTTTTG
jgi:hypothetical protein